MKPIVRRSVLMVYSILLIPIWGLAFLDVGTSNRHLGFVALILTYILTFLYVRHFGMKSKLDKLLIFIGPVFYLIASIIISESLSKAIMFPIVWAFIIFILAITRISSKRISNHILAFSVSVIYSYIIYPQTGLEMTYSSSPPNEPVRVNLSHFKFINSKRDTIQLEQLTKPLLIETWNETCAPCISSIKEMQDTLALRTDFEHFYLYQSRGGRQLDLDQTFSFKHIKHKDRIIVDLNNALFDSLGLNAYPYFLIYNKQGQLKGYRTGFIREQKKEILEEIYSKLESASK